MDAINSRSNAVVQCIFGRVPNGNSKRSVLVPPFDRAHEDWKLLQYGQLLEGRKLTIGEALRCIGAWEGAVR